MKIITIEGNIGSGKSTFVNELKDNIENVLFIDEPVDQWEEIKDKEGKTIIEKYYEDQKKYSFPFQMMAYISRLVLLKKAIESNKYDIIITERCLYTDKYVFTKMLYDEGLINLIEYSIYNKWFEEFIEDYNIYYVYLKTSPDTANLRVLKRSREGEKIDILYLTKCNDYHNKWLNDEKNVTIIDANNEKTIKDTQKWINIVRDIINKT